MTLPTRELTYSLRGRPDWAGRRLRFVLSARTYTGGVQVPVHEVVGELDEDGDGSVHLFPNDLGEIPTEWLVKFPDGSWESFGLEDGEEPVNLSDLLTP